MNKASREEQRHQHRRVDDWKKVLWIDKFKFELFGQHCRAYVDKKAVYVNSEGKLVKTEGIMNRRSTTASQCIMECPPSLKLKVMVHIPKRQRSQAYFKALQRLFDQ